VKSLLFACYFMLPFLSGAQEHQFDVMLMNKKIGTTVINKIIEAGGERYQLVSQSTAKVMFVKQSSDVFFDVFYKGGHLVSSLYKIAKEGEDIETKVNKAAGHYQVKSSLGSRTFTGTVTTTSIQLYFKEPIGISQVFLERIGDFVYLSKKAPGEYEYILPDGVKNIFRYKNGKLVEVEIKKGPGSVFLRPAST
jgi:hypothetical protein